MWKTENDKLRNEQQTRELKERISQLGRWHSRSKKSDVSRIWKMLFEDMDNLLKDEKHALTESLNIRLVVYPQQKRYLLQVHRYKSTLYHSVFGKDEIDYNQVISELNTLLKHYNLILVETSVSKKNNQYRLLNHCKEFVLKFANTIE